MKQSLHLRLGQQLTMTPQLQQAIRLLQLSTLDLQQEIQEALESNPLLDQDEYVSNEAESNSESNTDFDPDNPPTESHEAEQGELSQQFESSETQTTEAASSELDSSQIEAGDAMNKEEFSDDLPVDSTWDEMYSATGSSSGGMQSDMDSVFQGETSENLQEHLLWQMRLTPFSDTDIAIATTIIDSINDEGYLSSSLEDILQSITVGEGEETTAIEVEMDEVEVVLKRLQHFDPVGVAARDLPECLLIQLRQLSPETPWLRQACLILEQHMTLLGSRDFRQLARKLQLQEDDLRETLLLIHGLDPKPGRTIVPEAVEYVIPDVSVVKQKGLWVVELNPDTMPKLRVNDQYAAMSKGGSSSDRQFIRSHLQEAKWFIKSLESRNETLLKVSRCIVEHQQAFFEYGPEAMKPMVLNDIAQAVEMHESTISRVTTQKYMHTPRGIFELKYFFSSHVSTDSGGECSSTAIRALIKKLIAAEIPAKPLSDNKIAEVLVDQGIKVARRTIAKYRESLGIPPSNQRKSLF